MLSGSRLASTIKTALMVGAAPTSSQNTGMANNIVAHISTGIVSNAPGTITGTVSPAGGPLSAGAGSNGIIALIATALEGAFVSTFGTSTPQIKALADAISNHVSGLGKVEFASNNIVGIGTNSTPPPAPGILVNGLGSSGTVDMLSQSILANSITLALGQTSPSAQVNQIAQAIIDEIQNNAVVAYALGSVTGQIAAGGGNLLLGAGAGGTIS